MPCWSILQENNLLGRSHQSQVGELRSNSFENHNHIEFPSSPKLSFKCLFSSLNSLLSSSFTLEYLWIHTMHVSLMLIFNECITSGFIVVCIVDNMDLQTKSKSHENMVINMSIVNKIAYVLACRNGESPLMFNVTSHLFARLTHEILSWTLEEIFLIYVYPCIIL